MIYDFKSDDIVQDIITDDLSPIIEDIETEFVKLRRGEHISIFAPSSITKEILTYLLEDLDNTFLHSESYIELLQEDKENACLTLSYNGCLFIENARWYDNSLMSCDGVMNYVYDSFKKSDIDKMSSDNSPILVFGLKDKIEEDELVCTDDTESTHISRTKDGKLAGFSKSWSTQKEGMSCYSSYSHYSDDEDMVKSIARNWGINI